MALSIIKTSTKCSNMVPVKSSQAAQTVIQRLVADKPAHGVMDERLLAHKRLGQLVETAILTAEPGQPITQQGQITLW